LGPEVNAWEDERSVNLEAKLWTMLQTSCRPIKKHDIDMYYDLVTVNVMTRQFHVDVYFRDTFDLDAARSILERARCRDMYGFSMAVNSMFAWDPSIDPSPLKDDAAEQETNKFVKDVEIAPLL
jgi:hypothetical protein